jgi:hypothetical protein
MASVDPRLSRRVARLPGVKAAVRAGLGSPPPRGRTWPRTAPKDKPGLRSPAAELTSYGREAYTQRSGRRVGGMQGQYIMTRAARE